MQKKARDNRAMTDVNEKFERELIRKILEKAGSIVKEKAIKLCPVDKGQLRLSIHYEVNVARQEVRIFSDLPYSDDIEYGTPPGEVTNDERGALREWSERHGANPGKIIKYIERHGIKVGTEEKPLHITSYGRDSYRPFLRPAAHQSVPLIKEAIRGFA